MALGCDEVVCVCVGVCRGDGVVDRTELQLAFSNAGKESAGLGAWQCWINCRALNVFLPFSQDDDSTNTGTLI